MAWPKLTPLQARCAATLLATAALIVIYFSIRGPTFAYALEVPAHQHFHQVGLYERLQEELGDITEDHNFDRLEEVDDGPGWEDEEGVWRDLEDVFDNENDLERRQTPTSTESLTNNDPSLQSINANQTNFYQVPTSVLFGPPGPTGVGLPSNWLDGNTIFLPNGTQIYVGGNIDSGQGDNSASDDPIDSDGGESTTTEKRQDNGGTLYLSVTTCKQPTNNASLTSQPPQLTLYVSTTDQNPSPSSPDTSAYPLVEGYASVTINTSDTVYIGVSAPGLPNGFSGEWDYELAASIDNFYHVFNEAQIMLLLDTDSQSALLTTDNLTQYNSSTDIFQEWMNLDPPPFTIFAHNASNPVLYGMQRSFCALKNFAEIGPSHNEDQVYLNMTTRGINGKPKEQFYITGLERGTSMMAVMAQVGNSTNSGSGVVGGGGQIWTATEIHTKSDGNCQIIYDLEFCNQVAYAVPAPPRAGLQTDPIGAMSALAAQYDNNTSSFYPNFTFSLAQIACDTTASAQYSLARTCDDCNNAYIDWLCAVTIPRCADYTNEAPWLQPRNVNPAALSGYTSSISSQLSATPDATASAAPPVLFAQSPGQDGALLDNDSYVPMPSAPWNFAARNASLTDTLSSNSSRQPELIDETLQPGPYKELLPCPEYCYNLVQSCPAMMQFVCPFTGRGLERSYGTYSQRSAQQWLAAQGMGGGNAPLVCNFFGAVVNGTGIVATGRSSALTTSVTRLVLVAMSLGVVALVDVVW